MNDYQIKKIIDKNKKTINLYKIFSIILFVLETIIVLNFTFGIFGIFFGHNPANYYVFNAVLHGKMNFTYTGVLKIHFILIMLTYLGSIPVFIFSLIKKKNYMYWIVYPTILIAKLATTYFYYSIGRPQLIHYAIVMNLDLIILGIVAIINIITLYSANSKYKPLIMTILQAIKVAISVILVIYINIGNLNLLMYFNNSDEIIQFNFIAYLTFLGIIVAFSFPLLNGNQFISDSYLASSITILCIFSIFNLISIIGESKYLSSFIPFLATNTILFITNLVISIMLKTARSNMKENMVPEQIISENEEINNANEEKTNDNKITASSYNQTNENTIPVKSSNNTTVKTKEFKWLNKLFAGLMFILAIVMVIHFFFQPLTETYNTIGIINAFIKTLMEAIKSHSSVKPFDAILISFVGMNIFNACIVTLIVFFISMGKGKNYMPLPVTLLFIITRPMMYYYWSFPYDNLFLILNWDLFIYVSLLITYILIYSIINIKAIGIPVMIFRIIRILLSIVLLLFMTYILFFNHTFFDGSNSTIVILIIFMYALIIFSIPLMSAPKLESRSGLASAIVIQSTFGTVAIVGLINISLIRLELSPKALRIALLLMTLNLANSILILVFQNIKKNKLKESITTIKPEISEINNNESNDNDILYKGDSDIAPNEELESIDEPLESENITIESDEDIIPEENNNDIVDDAIDNEMKSNDDVMVSDSIIENKINNIEEPNNDIIEETTNTEFNNEPIIEDTSNEINELDNNEEITINSDEISPKDIDTNDNIIKDDTNYSDEDDDIGNYGKY